MKRSTPPNAVALVDHLLATNPEQQRLARKVTIQQKRLRVALGPEFELYLQVESMSNEKWLALCQLVFKLARALGRREGRQAVRKAE